MKRTKIVIVEDHEQMRQFLTEIVEKDDELTVAGTARNGVEACDTIRGREPDIVLLDLIMPEMDGLGVLEQFQADEFPETRPGFIVVSAVREEHMVREAFRLGASYYVMKPFDPDVLISRIKAAVRSGEKGVCHVKRILPYEDLDTVQSREIEAEIAEILHRIGVPAHIRGYVYLKKAIILSLTDLEMLQSVTKKLYPAVAEAFDTTPSRVERSIRHAIESAWDRGESAEKEELFGYTVHKAKGKPTNSEFIAMIADKLKMESGW